MKISDPIIQPSGKEHHKYLDFDRSISKKYGTKENRFSFKKVAFVRNCYWRLGLNLKQSIERTEDFMYRNHSKRRHPITWYLHLYNFLKNCSEETWKDIVRPMMVT